jgi:hypothetical protein
MRSTEARLAKVEKALSQVAQTKVDEAFQAEIAEWREAGGPISFVCGDTEAEADARVEALRGLGMIQLVDRVHTLPAYPEFNGKHFLRFEMLGEHGPEVIRYIRDHQGEPGREPPPGWRLPTSAAGQEP